jgi:hypothetical protein
MLQLVIFIMREDTDLIPAEHEGTVDGSGNS